MARRRMTALQRRYFGRRSSRRAPARAVSRRRRSSARAAPARRRSSGRRGFGGSLGSWLPLTKQEHIAAGLTGASMGLVVPNVRKFTDPYTSFLGSYQGEGTMYAIGAVAKKFGSGTVADVGKGYAFLATAAAAGKFTAPWINGTTTNQASTQGVTMLN